MCCDAVGAEEGRECQCNVSKTYYSEIYGLLMNL